MGEKPSALPANALVAGPPWAPGISDLARLRALTGNSRAVIHSVIRGGSMGTAIPDGARVRIRSGSEEMWRVGKVIAFLAGTRLMAHRVVYEGQRGLAKHFVLTQGDGNWLCDPPVNRSTVVGEVEAFATGDEWHAIGPARIRPHKQFAARASQTLMRLALERSPGFGTASSRPISWLRMAPRLMMSILRRCTVGNVRH